MAFIDQSTDKWHFSLLQGKCLCDILCILIGVTKLQGISHWSVKLFLRIKPKLISFSFYWTPYERLLTKRDKVWIQFSFVSISNPSGGFKWGLNNHCNTSVLSGKLEELGSDCASPTLSSSTVFWSWQHRSSRCVLRNSWLPVLAREDASSQQ